MLIIRGQGGLVVGGRGQVLASGGGSRPAPQSSSSSSSTSTWPSSSSSASNPLLAGLLAWYRANGINRAATGVAYDLAAVGTPGTAEGLGGIAGTAAASDGTGYWERSPALISAPPFSLAVWFRLPASPTGTNQALAQVVAVNLEQGIAMTMNRTYYVLDPFATIYRSGANGTDWHHAVLSYDGSTRRRWYDGVLIEDGSITATIGAAESLVYCRHDQDELSILTCQFAGVWDRVLDADEVTRLYNAGAGFDPTA